MIAPNGRFAYAINQGDNSEANISAYTIDSTRGALTPVAGSPFKDGPQSNSPGFGAVDTTSKFAYISNNGAKEVAAYTITASGALRSVKGSPFAAGTYPAGMSVCRVTAGKCIPPPL